LELLDIYAKVTLNYRQMDADDLEDFWRDY